MDLRLWIFSAAVAAALAWSAVSPHDYFTWGLEVLPILLAWPVMLATRRRFPLSTLLLVLIAGHGLILIVGGHYTYARVPLGEWARVWFGWTRNNYDKIGHFAQGFVPAILAREILIRASPLRKSRWLGPIVVSICLSISAAYELIEWLVAISGGAASTDFLGTQGDVWDTQSDMAMALIGAIVAVAFLSRAHDRALDRLARAQTS